MSKNKNYTILNKEEKNKELNVEIEISADYIDTFKSKAVKSIGKEIELKGFRKGMAPENLIVSYVGETKIFEEAFFEALNQILPIVMVEEKINALTEPKINVTKMAPGNAAVLKATFILMPDIVLADYKKIAKSVKRNEGVKVEDKEIDDYILYIQKSRAQSEALKEKTSGAGARNLDKTENLDKSNSDGDVKKEVAPLPEFNDQFVKTLGNFKNVEDFKTQLKENMLADKKKQVAEKRRIEIIENIVKESKADLPDMIIEDELDRMFEQFKSDIRNFKMEPEAYLKEIKKTENDLRKEWRTDATKRAKMNLILPKIATEEKIEADKEKVEHEAKHLAEHHKVDEVRAKQYVEFVLKNEEVLKFLENLK